MTAMIFKLVGGIGLFLLGMVLLTDGLKAFAGESLRRALVRFTGTPLKAFGAGALVTALVQSSSATTVTVIGFVSAGLLTFPQAVGVVMGASLGTTGTGWIVAVLGLKISLGFYALPGLWGHVLAMVIGMVMTVIMQSSSAAVATTLTALHTGTVNFEQAASLVIGAALSSRQNALAAPATSRTRAK